MLIESFVQNKLHSTFFDYDTATFLIGKFCCRIHVNLLTG